MNERGKKKDPCAEITAKLEAKRKELEEKQAEIEKLTAESLRAAGLDDVLTPKSFKQLEEKYAFYSVTELHRYLKEFPITAKYFKDWVKAGMPESSDEEKHKKVLDILFEHYAKKFEEEWPASFPETPEEKEAPEPKVDPDAL